MHFWQGEGVILTMMTMVKSTTTTTKTTTVNEYTDIDTNGKDNNDLIF